MIEPFKVEVYFQHPDAKLPYQPDEYAAAYDLYSIDEGILYFGETKTFSTGLIMRPPEGYHIRLYGRSGWGKKYGIGIPHGIGIIDYNFAGPKDIIQVVLRRSSSTNMKPESREPLHINKGDRIAQMTIEKTNRIQFSKIDHPPSDLTRGGFGHSGVK